MLSSSKGEAKQEARFAARLDVLLERVDTLASTVATTSSGLAKKDGEIAALQRALEARDQTLHALVEHANRAAQAPAVDLPVDATELRSLRNAVAALTKERASGLNAAHVERLDATVRALTERVDALTAAAAAPKMPVPDPALTALVNSVAAELAVVKAAVDRQPEELVAMLSTLRERVDELADLERGVTAEQLERRVAPTTDMLASLRERLDTLADSHSEYERTHAVDESQLARRFEETADGLEKVAHRLAALELQSERLDAFTGRLGELERKRSADDERLDRRFTVTGEALAKVSHRLEAIAGELERTHSVDEEALGRRFEETEGALTRLRQRLDAFHSVDEDALDRRFDQAEETFAQRLDAVANELRRSRSLDEEALGRRFVETNEALAKLAQRLDTLAHTVESAASSLGDKERDLASLEGHFNESSTRIESIVDDIREALHALPELSATSSADLGVRLERLETAGRKTNETGARAAAELSERIDVIDQRLATVADEVSRAKTLWPVALRSLEARLEQVAHTREPEPHLAATSEDGSPDGPDDLLTGLRDSLQAMESVAADMARASQTLTGVPPADDALAADGVVGGEGPSEHAHSDHAESPEPDPAGQLGTPKAAAAGATIVPLRASEP